MKFNHLKLPSLGDIVLFGAALRILLLVYALFVPDFIYAGDSGEYLALARGFLETGVYAAETDRPLPPDSVRPPVYPAFLSLLLLLGDGTPFLVLLVQVLLSVGNIWLAHRLAMQLGAGENAACLAALVLAIDLSSILYAATVMAETLFTTLLLLFASALVRAIEIPNPRNITALSVFAAGLTLTKPVATFLPLVSAALMLFLAPVQPSKKTLAATGHLVLVVALLLPWGLRNARKHDYLGISTVQGFNLLYYNGALAKARAEGTGIDAAEDALTEELHARLSTDSPTTGDYTRAMQRLGVQTVFAHFDSYVLLHARGMLAMLVDPGRINLQRLLSGQPSANGLLEAVSTQGLAGGLNLLLRQQPALVVLFAAALVWQIVLSVLAFSGCAAVSSKRRSLLLWLLTAIILYFLLVTGPIGAARFRVPITPMLAILAGLGLVQLQQKYLS